jgi:hypothetical protein
MVIRRIREHVTTHNWFAVGIDVVIVIVGVFLGTQANNWNEARSDREEGRSSAPGSLTTFGRTKLIFRLGGPIIAPFGVMRWTRLERLRASRRRPERSS